MNYKRIILRGMGFALFFITGAASLAQTPVLQAPGDISHHSFNDRGTPQRADVTPRKPEYLPDQLIVKLKTPVEVQKLQDSAQPIALSPSFDPLYRKYSVTEVQPVYLQFQNGNLYSSKSAAFFVSFQALGLSNIYRLKTSGAIDVMAAVDEFQKLPEVAYAEPNYIYRTQTLLNDPFLQSSGAWGQPYLDLWGVHKISAPAAWDLATGAGVTVAIVDTGCDLNHPELADNVWKNQGEIEGNSVDDDHNGFVDDKKGWNFVNNNNNPQDNHGHGTHVAGTIAAVGNNGIGIAGIAWQAKAMCVKALNDFGMGSADTAARGIVYAARSGARVINMSWGGLGFSRTLEDAFVLANDLNVTLVAAAGNDNEDASLYFPAGSRYVITVASSDHTDVKSDFSNYGVSVDITAPGGDSKDDSPAQIYQNILSLRSRSIGNGGITDGRLWVDPSYLRIRGTSMASPHVAGVVALLLQRFTSLTPEEVRQVIRQSADDIGAPGWDGQTAYGRVNALNAVTSTLVGSARFFEPRPIAFASATVPIRITATSSDFREYRIEYGAGENPETWFPLMSSAAPVLGSAIPDWDVDSIPDGTYNLRLRVFSQSGTEYLDRVAFILDRVLLSAPARNSAWSTGQPIVFSGTAAGGLFSSFEIQFQDPLSGGWRSDGITLSDGGVKKVWGGILGVWNPSAISRAGFYKIRIVVKRTSLPDIIKESQILIDPTLHSGWPRQLPGRATGRYTFPMLDNLVAADIDQDGKVEILVAYGDQLSVYRDDGSMATGWPAKIQPFWPGAYFQVSPAVADLNGDGFLEIVAVDSSGGVYAWNHYGTMLPGWPKDLLYNWPDISIADINGDSKPELVAIDWTFRIYAFDTDGNRLAGWPYSPDPRLLSAPAVADLDGDRKMETVVKILDGKEYIYVINHDGKIRSGWPVPLTPFGINTYLTSADIHPLVGDVDGDGQLEIVAVTESGGDVFVFHHDGTLVPGWPKQIPNAQFCGGLSLASVSGDNKLDIILGVRSFPLFMGGSSLYVFNGRGDVLPGWPVLAPVTNNFQLGFGSAAVMDIDGDGAREIVVDGDGDLNMPYTLYAYKRDGTVVPGFPKPAIDRGAGPNNTPAIMDFDGDGLLELAWLDDSGNLYMWDLSGPAVPDSHGWPMFHHDAARTGANGGMGATFRRDLALSGGGVSATSTTALMGPVRTGYASVYVSSGNVPYGTAVFSVKQNGVVVSEAGVPASPPTTRARIFVDYRPSVPGKDGSQNSGEVSVNTGFAMVNPGTGLARVSLTLRTSSGTVAGQGTLDPNQHRALFLNELNQMAPDFNLPPTFNGYGTLDIVSDQPLSVLGLRLTTTQRGETLITSTPIADLDKPASHSSLYFPQFVDGGGFKSMIILLNTSEATEKGRLRLLDNGGQSLRVSIGGSFLSEMPYEIGPGDFRVYLSDGDSSALETGSAQVLPDADAMTPVGAGVLSYSTGGVLITETGIPSATPTTHAHIYIDRSGGHDTGLAIATPDASFLHVTLKAYQTDGVTPMGSGTLDLEGHGHEAKFAGQFIPSLPAGFTGVLDVSAPTPFVALTLRALSNTRGDFLLTTFPVADANQPAPAPLIFPQIADGGGYHTQFILLSTGGSASTTFNFYGDDGAPLTVGKSGR